MRHPREQSHLLVCFRGQVTKHHELNPLRAPRADYYTADTRGSAFSPATFRGPGGSTKLLDMAQSWYSLQHVTLPVRRKLHLWIHLQRTAGLRFDACIGPSTETVL